MRTSNYVREHVAVRRRLGVWASLVFIVVVVVVNHNDDNH